MGSALARVYQFCLALFAMGMTCTFSMAQSQQGTVEMAPPAPAKTGNGGAGSVKAAFHGEYLYESCGYVIHQPVNRDREFFEITPGNRGQAIFVNGAVAQTVDLEFVLTMLSPTQPGVSYWVFRESNSPRLWAFQADCPSFYGYGIFVNGSGNPFSIRDWALHDYSRRSPDWPD